jgi:uncharacterized protein YbcI
MVPIREGELIIELGPRVKTCPNCTEPARGGKQNFTQDVDSDGMNKSKGQIEAEITEAIIRFEKEFMGRGPLEARTFLVDDMILVRLKNVLTQAELKLAEAPNRKEGGELIKRIRIALLEQGRTLLVQAIEDIVDIEVKSLHTDISTRTGERIILFSMASPVRVNGRILPT